MTHVVGGLWVVVEIEKPGGKKIPPEPGEGWLSEPNTYAATIDEMKRMQKLDQYIGRHLGMGGLNDEQEAAL